LYKDILGYKIHDVETAYYADKEDAYDMRCDLTELLMKVNPVAAATQAKADAMGQKEFLK